MPVWVDPDYAVKEVTATITAPTPAATTVSAAGIPATGHPGSQPSTRIPLFTQATAAATSQVIDRGSFRGPAGLLVVNVGTGSPSMTVDIQGSVDNINFYNIAYALVATPNTVAVAQITITTSATTTYLLLTDQAWRFLRVVTASITTQTYTITYFQ